MLQPSKVCKDSSWGGCIPVNVSCSDSKNKEKRGKLFGCAIPNCVERLTCLCERTQSWSWTKVVRCVGRVWVQDWCQSSRSALIVWFRSWTAVASALRALASAAWGIGGASEAPEACGWSTGCSGYWSVRSACIHGIASGRGVTNGIHCLEKFLAPLDMFGASCLLYFDVRANGCLDWMDGGA